MKSVIRFIFLLSTGSGLLMSPLAWSHARLMTALPTEVMAWSASAPLDLTFHEAVVIRLSRVTVQNQQRQTVPLIAPSDLRPRPTLRIAPQQPLPAGRYTVSWDVLSVDGHRVQGRQVITVTRP